MEQEQNAQPDSHAEPTESFFEVHPSVVTRKDSALENLQRIPTLSTRDAVFYETLLDLAQPKIVSRTRSVIIPLSELEAELKTLGEPATRQTLMKRSRMLSEANVFVTVKEPRAGRPLSRFITQAIYSSEFADQVERENPAAIGGRKIQRRVRRDSRQVLELLKRSNAQFIKTFAVTSQPKTDHWFTGILDRSMRFDAREKVKDGIITNTVNLGAARLTIQAESTSRKSSEIAILADQRVIRAIITEVVAIIESKIAEHRKQHQRPGNQYTEIQQNRDNPDHLDFATVNEADQVVHEDTPVIENRFYIDVVRIAKLMNYSNPNGTKVRELVNESIRRLYETSFRVLMETPNPEAAEFMRRRFGLADDRMDFRFITDLKSQYEKEFEPEGVDLGNYRQASLLQDNQFSEDLTPEQMAEKMDPLNPKELRRVRVWAISIDNYLFDRLKDSEVRSTFLAHREILHERSGLAQTLYNVLSSRIGRTNRELVNQPEQTIKESLKNLHDFLWPTRKWERFEENFFGLMRRHAENAQKFDAAVEKANKSKRRAPFTPQTIRMFGFVFVLSIKDAEWWVNIQRDRNDSLNGDYSIHNRLLKRRAAKS